MFLLYYCPNQCGHARIGQTVSKRNVPKAVNRNQIKRVIRESFRQHPGLPAIDIVIIVKRNILLKNLATSQAINKPELHATLIDVWKKVGNLCGN